MDTTQTPDHADQNLRSAFFNAAIPARFHDKALTLTSIPLPAAKEIARFAKSELAGWPARGGVLQLADDTPHALQAFYLLARSAVLRGIPTVCLALPSLVEHIESKTIADIIQDTTLLMVPGLCGNFYKRPVCEEASLRVEWFLRGWVLNGRPLGVQGPVPLMECAWWSPTFVALLNSSLTASFNEKGERTV